MDTERDVTRIVQSWLRTDEHESADRVLDNVLALLDATPQRRSWWPARRIAPMSVFAKLAAAAAAVAVVALFVIIAIPRGSSGVGGSSAPPSLTPSPSAPGPSSSTVASVFPPMGAVAIGRQSMTRGGVRLSVDVPTSGWSSDQSYFISKDFEAKADYVSFLFWDPSPKGVFVDSCAHKAGPQVGPSIADLASAVSKMPDVTLVSGPSNVTVAGRAAKLVVVKVPLDAKCPAVADGFDLWYNDIAKGEVRYASALGVTLRVWIIDVDGTRLFIEAESAKEAGPKVGQEIQKMVDSIQFE
jgi:hypothetical protein